MLEVVFAMYMLRTGKITDEEDEFVIDSVRQYQVAVKEDQKVSTLLDLLNATVVSQAVVFCNSIGRAKSLYEELQSRNFACSCVHSDID